MFKMIKRLSPVPVIAAITFLLIQVVCDLYIPALTAAMVNDGLVKGNTSFILQLGIIMILVSLGGFAAALLNTNISAKISYKLGCVLRKDVYRKATQFSNDEFDKIGTSSLITRNTNDVTQVQNLIEMFLKFLILAPLYLIGGVVMAYKLSPSLSTVFIIIVPIVALAAIGISVYANPLYAKMQKTIDRLNLIFREGLNGVKVIRAFGKEKQEYERYERDNNEYTKTSIRVNTIVGLLMPIMSLVMSLATIAITWIGSKSIDSGSMEIGTMMGVIAYSAQIMTGFMLIINVISSIPRGITSAKRIDAKNARQTLNKEASLVFENVSYAYQGAEKNAVDDISFSIYKGQTLAIIGSTGAGKTTLINLVERFYEISGGAIFLDGVDIRNMDYHTLRSKIGMVLQDTWLFSGTIYDNIRYGNKNVTDEQIYAAAKTAYVDDFVRKLPDGYSTVLNEEASNISGGQCQLITITRAFISNPDILILDEATSNVDSRTEMLIQKAMRRLLKGRTSFVVAHRLSTIYAADNIIVMKDGDIVETGNHGSLLTANGTYADIYNSQFAQRSA